VTVQDDDGDADVATTEVYVAGVMVNEDGVLRIVGTTLGDKISIDLGKGDRRDDSGDQLRVHATFGHSGKKNDAPEVENLFDLDEIQSILMQLGDGDDRVDIHEKVLMDATIYAGPGRDTVKSGGGDDMIFGGEDDDDLSGGDGSDSMDGGPGEDQIDGGEGNDVLHGGDNSDQVRGNRGRDILMGGSGKDDLHGQNDDDILIADSYMHWDNPFATSALLAEWSREDLDFDARVASLQTGVGPEAQYRISRATIVDDEHDDKLRRDKGDWLIDSASDLPEQDLLEDILAAIAEDIVNSLGN
jgi:Ca2+-binding RTX toxin-like protein